MIKVYTTPTCIYCHALVNWLDEEGIEYQELDAASMPNITAVPVTIITDHEDKNPIQIIGFETLSPKRKIDTKNNNKYPT